MSGWNLDELPDQTGRTAVVTGATGGLGQVVGLELARRGARVVLAARSKDKLKETQQVIEKAVPDAEIHTLVVDLSDFAKVRRAAEVAARFGPLDVLVNNAGVMATPEQRTVDGLDLQMATNHFGPFLLTGLLLPQLVASGNGRVVTVSSNGHWMARAAPVDDPRLPEGRYSRWGVYGQTKLANLLFTYELEKRLTAKGLPGTPSRRTPATRPPICSRPARPAEPAAGWVDPQRDHVGHRAAREDGRAADPDGGHRRPARRHLLRTGGFHQWRGLPQVVTSSRPSRDESAQARLWAISQTTTGLRYP